MSDTSQGPGWWQASDGKWYPPEQAPGYQAGDQGGGAPASGGTDLGSVFSYSWNKFIQNIGEWIVLWLIMLGIAILFVVISIALAVGGGIAGTSFRFNFVGIIYGIIVGMVQGVLLVAVAKGAVMATSGQKIDVAAAFKFTGNNIVAGIIFGAAYGLLNSFCGILGVIAFLFLGFLPILSAIDDKGADALSESVNLSTSKPGESMVWMAIAWLITGFICSIGAPIAMIGATYMVKQYRGEPVAP